MDRVKKLKVKKTDGSFTDYIPIGADAEYIDTSDNLNLQEHLDLLNNNKIKCYTSVAEMKADERLKIGDTVQTLGYYEANDGGGAIYLIKNDSSLINDNGSIHDLNNGLKAELNIINRIINVEQFGVKGDGITDETDSIKKCLLWARKNNATIYFKKRKKYVDTETITIDIYQDRIDGNCAELLTNCSPVFNFISSASSTYEQVGTVIQNLYLENNGSDRSNPCLEFNCLKEAFTLDLSHFTFKNCHYSCLQSIFFDASKTCIYYFFAHCKMKLRI